MHDHPCEPYFLSEEMAAVFQQTNPHWRDGDANIWIQSKLTSVRQREKLATKGRWRWEDNYQKLIATEHDPLALGGMPVLRAVDEMGNPAKLVISPADATFISHARTDLPAVLAELDKTKILLGEFLREVTDKVTDPDGHLDPIKGRVIDCLLGYVPLPDQEETKEAEEEEAEEAEVA